MVDGDGKVSFISNSMEWYYSKTVHILQAKIKSQKHVIKLPLLEKGSRSVDPKNIMMLSGPKVNATSSINVSLKERPLQSAFGFHQGFSFNSMDHRLQLSTFIICAEITKASIMNFSSWVLQIDIGSLRTLLDLNGDRRVIFTWISLKD